MLGFLRDFVAGSAPLTVLVLTLALAWPVGSWIALRWGGSRRSGAALVAAVGGIAALTLTPNPTPVPAGALPPHYLTQLDQPGVVWRAVTAAPSDSEQIANIALYVPAGFIGWLVWRRVARVALLGVALTVFVETCQVWIAGRAGSLTDIRNNTLGALIGAVAAPAGGWLLRRLRR